LLWDPHLDVDRLVDDYLPRRLRPGGRGGQGVFRRPGSAHRLDCPAVHRHHGAGRRGAEDQAPGLLLGGRAPLVHAEVLAGLAEKLVAAEQAAAGDEAVLGPGPFAPRGLRYAELRGRTMALRDEFRHLAADAPQRPDKRKEMKDGFSSLKEFYRQQATTWVIAPQLVRMLPDEMPNDGK